MTSLKHPKRSSARTVAFLLVVLIALGTVTWLFFGGSFSRSAQMKSLVQKLDKTQDAPTQEQLLKELTGQMENQFAALQEGDITAEQFYTTWSALAQTPAASDLYEQYQPIAQNWASWQQSAAQGQAAYQSGDYAACVQALQPLADTGFQGFPALESSYDDAWDQLYTSLVQQASDCIDRQDFEGAQQIVAQLQIHFPDDGRVQNLAFSCTNMELFDGDALHFFFHPLIAYPELAFDKKGNPTGEDNYMITVKEFNEVIRQLYEKNYVLINPYSLFDATYNEDGSVQSVTKRDIYVPSGKTPVILSVDDINYYEYMRTDGQVYKLVLDENGDVETYSKDENGNDCYSKENEIVPLLDTFVKEHPDFSLNGAKGMLNLTGYEGILGYRTDEPTWENYGQEVAQATAVVKRLKETGWCFASHSQGHRHSAEITFSLFVNDTDRWVQEVGSIVGPTAIYVYPFGETVPVDSDKFSYLTKKGFAMMCTVGSSCRIQWGTNYAIEGRRAIDGIALRDKRLYNVFDVPSIIDPVRPSYAKWLEWAKSHGIVS